MDGEESRISRRVDRAIVKRHSKNYAPSIVKPLWLCSLH